MPKHLTIAFTFLTIATPIVTEYLRTHAEKSRFRRSGPAGTQDIALFGTMTACAFFLVALVSGLIWLIES